MPENTSATDIVVGKLSTKLNAWLENVVGEQSGAQPVKSVQVLDAKTTCTAMYSGLKLCFNAWLTIGITNENVNIGGNVTLVTDSSMKNGTFVKPKDAGIGFYELADACIGWEDIPICAFAKGK